MRKELRGAERYTEMGRVICEQICAFPGVLDDISISGCKVHYTFPVEIDKEKEYVVLFQLSRQFFSDKLELICRPMWVEENEEKNQTNIGFNFLRSPDSPELAKFIESLRHDEKMEDITSLLIKDDTDFI